MQKAKKQKADLGWLGICRDKPTFLRPSEDSSFPRRGLRRVKPTQIKAASNPASRLQLRPVEASSETNVRVVHGHVCVWVRVGLVLKPQLLRQLGTLLLYSHHYYGARTDLCSPCAALRSLIARLSARSSPTCPHVLPQASPMHFYAPAPFSASPRVASSTIPLNPSSSPGSTISFATS